MKEDKTLYALEIPLYGENFITAEDSFKSDDIIDILDLAQNDCDIIGLKFDVENHDQIKGAKKLLKGLLVNIRKPLMINGTNNDSIDSELLPELIKILDKPAIISNANENTYKKIVPYVIKGGHKLVLKTPIDINLCKELNILSADLGLPLDKIIIDTDIGGLGYGLDYGYSTIEKIKLENDEYLNMPIISFAPFESLKTKEAKSDAFSKSWGQLKTRAKMFEIAAASAVKAAGADIIVLHNPESVSIMKGLDA